MDIILSSQATESSVYDRPQNAPGVLCVSQEAAIFVEDDVTGKDQRDATNAVEGPELSSAMRTIWGKSGETIRLISRIGQSDVPSRTGALRPLRPN